MSQMYYHVVWSLLKTFHYFGHGNQFPHILSSRIVFTLCYLLHIDHQNSHLLTKWFLQSGAILAVPHNSKVQLEGLAMGVGLRLELGLG